MTALRTAIAVPLILLAFTLLSVANFVGGQQIYEDWT